MTAATPHAADDTVYERRWWTLAVLCLSLLIVFVGNSSLNVALPSLARDLGATESQLQWVVASYSLVFAGLLFSAGALGDRFGRKGALQFGLAAFFVGAAAASQATTMGQIIGCRAVMGLGAAFIMPSTLSILVNVFPEGERAKAIAIWAATVGVAGAIGPLMSGFLLTHFWFGSVFLINLPIIAVALVGGWVLVPKSRDPEEARLDPVGALLSIVGISSLVFALIQAPDKGWGAPQTVGAFIVSFVVLALFVMWELHTDEPMLDMRYFRNPSFSTGSGGMLLVFLAMYGVLFLMTQYFQLVLDDTPLAAAARLLPMAPIMLIVAPLTPQLSRRFGANRVVGAGMVLIAVGFVIFSQVGLATPYWVILLMLIPLVSGMAMSMSPMTSAIMAAVPARRAGAGSAMNDATRELGAALGVAVLGSIAASQYSSHLHDAVAKLPAASRSAASSSIAGALEATKSLPASAAHAFDLLARTAFVDGIRVAGLFGAALALAAAVVTVRYLPRSLPDEGALHSPVDSLENVAELGLGGVMPVFADEHFPGDPSLDADVANSVPALTNVPEHPA
jgi:MFS transporter, DHA2 family, multidrug resistance protein